MLKAIIAAIGLAVGLAGAANAAERDAAFRIMWKGHPVGYHLVNVEETDDGIRVETRVEMRIKFGPIPVYRYSHQAVEYWRNGELQFLASVTTDDGVEKSVGAWRENGALMVEGTAYSGLAPEGAIPASCWSRSVLGAHKVFSMQDGEIIDVAVEDLGESVSPAGISADHFKMNGTLSVDVWFKGDEWVGSQFIAEGEEFTLRPLNSDDEEQKLLAMLD